MIKVLDLSGKISEASFHRKYFILSLFTTPLMKARCRLLGIKLGQGVRFFGMTKLTRFNDARLEIGNNCRFDSTTNRNPIGLSRPCNLFVERSAELIIGNGCGFGGTSIWSSRSVRIGNGVKCGANCLIFDYEGHPEDPRTTPAKPIVIEDNVWLGTNVVVMKGVTIGKNTLIGANSVVTRSIPANSIAVGAPAKVVRTIDIPTP